MALHTVQNTEWISTGEAAHRLQVGSINTVKRWAAEGKLQSRRIGNRIKISAVSVDRLLQASDNNVTRMQRLAATLNELAVLGEELSAEEWHQVLAERPGRLPRP